MPYNSMPAIYQPLMEGRSIKADHCLVCGRNFPLNDHHVVWRSQGEMYDERGRKRPKPELTLCGRGDHLYDLNRRMYCHGKAHHHLLHFRWVGHWEYLETEEVTDYVTALKMEGWVPLGTGLGM